MNEFFLNKNNEETERNINLYNLSKDKNIPTTRLNKKRKNKLI